MILDILYQLLKKVVSNMYILQLLKTIIKTKFESAHIKIGTSKLL